MKRDVWTTAVVLGMLAASSTAGGAQSPGPSAELRTTRSGVYNLQQANAGRDTYDGMCSSCHNRASHTGEAFLGKWAGKSLWDLYQFISSSMPKNEPGSLSEEEYVQVVAYLLRLNGMPPGSRSLPKEEAALRGIRFETNAAQRTGGSDR